MSIEITSRHEKINERVQQYAREKADDLYQNFPKIEHVHIMLEFEGRLYRAQVVVKTKGNPVVGTGEHEESIVTAIDDAMDKAIRQLRKHRDRMVESRHKV